MTILCTLLGHRTKLVTDADRSVIQCQRCPYEEGATPVLKPGEAERQARVKAQQTAADARIVAEREARAARIAMPVLPSRQILRPARKLHLVGER